MIMVGILVLRIPTIFYERMNKNKKRNWKELGDFMKES